MVVAVSDQKDTVDCGQHYVAQNKGFTDFISTDDWNTTHTVHKTTSSSVEWKLYKYTVDTQQ